MRISKRDLNFLLALLGLVAFLALYFLVGQNFQLKADAADAAAAALEPQVAQLEEHYQNLTTYEQETRAYQASIADTIKQYPTGVEDEEFLVYLLGLERDTGVGLQSVSFEAPTALLQFPCEVEGGAVVTGTLDYPRLKTAIDYLYRSPQRTALDALAVSYNAETGGLTATFTIAKYLLSWEGAPASPVEMPRMNQGTANLFGNR